jgi:glutathione synthase/RimK-type ligase-like ATP-grasp enzyme
MKTIGIIIGTNDQAVSRGYYLKNKKKLQILKEYDLQKLNYIPYDYAIFAEIKSLEKKYNANVIPLFGYDLSLEDCNLCDVIFCIYEGVFSFNDGGIESYQNYMNILKKTRAKVYPSQEMQELIIQKNKYMKYLQKKGYQLTPTYYINNDNYDIKKIVKFIERNNYNTIILKPELGGFKSGFKIIKNPSSKKIKSCISSLKKKGYQRLLLQSFLEEFNKYGEIKTYWINNQFIYAYNQKWRNNEGIFFKQNTIDKELLQYCITVGKKLLQDIKKDHENLLHCRIDFACCLNNDNHCRDFFINEIEICPTIAEQDSDKNTYKLLAEHIMKYVF